MPRVRLGDGPDAIVVDLDTIEDVVKLHQTLHQAPTRQQPSASAASQPTGRKVLTIALGSLARTIFRNGQYAALQAMHTAGDTGVGTGFMAELLGVPSPKSIPPIVAAWGKRAAKAGWNLRELLDVDRGYEHGKPSTSYRLTPKGREVLRPDTETARIENDSGR